jgi:hypothetical protein
MPLEAFPSAREVAATSVALRDAAWEQARLYAVAGPTLSVYRRSRTPGAGTTSQATSAEPVAVIAGYVTRLDPLALKESAPGTRVADDAWELTTWEPDANVRTGDVIQDNDRPTLRFRVITAAPGEGGGYLAGILEVDR